MPTSAKYCRSSSTCLLNATSSCNLCFPFVGFTPVDTRPFVLATVSRGGGTSSTSVLTPLPLGSTEGALSFPFPLSWVACVVVPLTGFRVFVLTPSSDVSADEIKTTSPSLSTVVRSSWVLSCSSILRRFDDVVFVDAGLVLVEGPATTETEGCL